MERRDQMYTNDKYVSMLRRLVLIVILLTVLSSVGRAQVKIRIFANRPASSATFTSLSGKYILISYLNAPIEIGINEPVMLARLNGRLVFKRMDSPGIICDSLRLSATDSTASFSVRINSSSPVRQVYSGDLACYEDMNSLFFINITDIEKYIAGVVRAEGGTGKNNEYFKTQAVIARTYMYKYFDKHAADRYNLCDNTHCQAYKGITSDSEIIKATFSTHNQVILAPDSTLIISAFHSNCGGETASSEDVWLTSQPYLKKVIDPYCKSSRNAVWEKKMSLTDWITELAKSGYKGPVDKPESFTYPVKSRSTVYKANSFSIPVNTLRTDLKLRSSYFSVTADSSNVTISGRGYGHGVGLCQEGAIEMAAKGFNYKQIIEFYYFGVNITDVKNAVNFSISSAPKPPEGGL